MDSRRHFLKGAIAASVLPASRVLACDDPPNHYSKPCRSAYSSYSAYIPIAIADNLFAKNKVETVPTLISAIEAVTATLADKEVAVASLLADEAIRALAEGANFFIVATPTATVELGLWTTGTLKALQDLKGREIGVAPLPSGQFLAYSSFERQAGITFKPVVTRYRAMLEDLKARKLSGALFPTSWEQTLRQYDLKLLGSVKIPYARDLVVVPTNIFGDRANRGFFDRMIKSLRQASALLLDATRRQGNIAAIAKYGNIAEDAAERVYQESLQSAGQFDLNPVAVNAIFDDYALGPADSNQKARIAKIPWKTIVTTDLLK